MDFLLVKYKAPYIDISRGKCERYLYASLIKST